MSEPRRCAVCGRVEGDGDPEPQVHIYPELFPDPRTTTEIPF